MHSTMTMILRSITSCVSDWLITAHRVQKKTFRNRSRSISESQLSQVKTCASVYATYESFLSKVAFESDFRKKTFRCVIGFSSCCVCVSVFDWSLVLYFPACTYVNGTA